MLGDEEEEEKHDGEEVNEHHKGEEQQGDSPSDHEVKTDVPEEPTADHHEQPTHDNKEAAHKEVVNSDHPQEQHTNQNL